MKIVVVRQLISRGLWGLVMVLVGYGSNNNRLRVCERVEWFAILIASIFTRGYYLQRINLLSMSEKKSVIVSAIVPVYALGKQGDIKTVSVKTRLTCSLGLWRSMYFWNSMKVLLVGIVGVPEYKNRETKNGWGI